MDVTINRGKFTYLELVYTQDLETLETSLKLSISPFVSYGGHCSELSVKDYFYRIKMPAGNQFRLNFSVILKQNCCKLLNLCQSLFIYIYISVILFLVLL